MGPGLVTPILHTYKVSPQEKFWWDLSHKEKHEMTVLVLGCKISYKRLN